MSPSLPRKVLAWPHPDSSDHVIWSTERSDSGHSSEPLTQPLFLWLLIHCSLWKKGKENRSYSATYFKIRLIVLMSNLKDREEVSEDNVALESLDRSSVPDSNTFLHQFHVQTWIHQFSDPSESHLCLMSPSPRSTAVANSISGIAQATFTCTKGNRLPGEIGLKQESVTRLYVLK